MPSIIKSTRGLEKPLLQMHCFPDLLCGGSAQRISPGRNKAAFQRIDYRKGGRLAPAGSGMAGAENAAGQAGRDDCTAEERARREGFERGVAEGRQAGLAEFKTICESLRRALQELEGLEAATLQQAEGAVVSLALAIARKVVEQTVRVDEQVVLRSVGKALRAVEERAEVRIRINPQDHALLEDPAIAATLPVDKERFRPDPAIGRGGCVVRSARGELDARIEGQFEVIAEALREACGREKPR